MTKFGIGIREGQVKISLDENLEETDIMAMLTFDEGNAEHLLCTHAGIQSYWEALTVRLKKRHDLYKEEWVKKWWAHNKRYAKYVLTAYKEKNPTGDAIKDMVIQIYSSETTEIERGRYGTTAYKVAVDKKQFYGTDAEFYVAMYKYLYVEPVWYFENMVSTLKQMQEDFEIVAKVAERLNTQGFHLDLYAKMLMARRFNMNSLGMSESETMDKIGGVKR